MHVNKYEKPDPKISLVEESMIEFAERTGLSPEKPSPRRYLWTDAFAVCNYLELHHLTHDEEYRQLALKLVDQVHNILGRHRQDSPRSGWISGLDEHEGRIHPTAGGLRIGKELNERGPDEPFDDRLEWDRDGQYYHYLTKWMHALNRVSQATGDATYNRWAVELAKTVHSGFVYVPYAGGGKRMYWKMSIDLSRPLVPSMGHHDPLDGFITYNELQVTAARNSQAATHPDLASEIADMAGICKGKNWATEDPLGVGGLLSDAYRAAQMITKLPQDMKALLTALLADSQRGLNAYGRTNSLNLPAEYRLAFRELGLSIGLKAVERLHRMAETPGAINENHELRTRIDALMRYAPLIEMIEDFWLERSNRQSGTWLEHREINMVMLATSLAPDGFLAI